MGAVKKCMLVKTQLDTRKIVFKRVISYPDCKNFTYNQQEKNYHLVEKHAQPSSKQSTVCFSVNKISQATTLTNNIAERNMKLSNKNVRL